MTTHLSRQRAEELADMFSGTPAVKVDWVKGNVGRLDFRPSMWLAIALARPEDKEKLQRAFKGKRQVYYQAQLEGRCMDGSQYVDASRYMVNRAQAEKSLDNLLAKAMGRKHKRGRE